MLLLLERERDLLLEADLVFFEFFTSLFSSDTPSCFDSPDSENFLGAFFFPTEVIFFFFNGAFPLVGWAVGCFAQGLANDARDAQAQKQGYYSQPYAFVQAQGGLNSTLTSGNIMKPTFSIAGGYMFTHAVGLRLHINGMNSKNDFDSIDNIYQFKYINSNLDLMVNLTNLGKKPNGPFNVYLVAGAGLIYCWNNEEFARIARTGVIKEDISNAWINKAHKDLISHNIRAGLLFDYDIMKNVSVGAEFDFNNVSDRFDSRYSGSSDWMATGQISVTYKFGHKAYGSDRTYPTQKK